MAWKITHDMIETDRVGKGTKADLKGETFSARLLDDDLEHYYTIAFDRAAWDGEGLERCWEWAMYDSGATHLCVSLDTLEKLGTPPETMTLYRDRIAFTKGPHKGYCTLFA